MQRILEIGPGTHPACLTNGNIFQGGNVAYYGVDADTGVAGHLLDICGDSLRDRGATITASDRPELDFPKESFDHFIMCSVFGSYTLPTEDTASSLENTQLTVFEAFRVLRDGGEIAIAEENTPKPPATPYRIGSLLLEAGFDSVRVFPCQNMSNPHWWDMRTRYWGIEDRDGYQIGDPIDRGWGYLVHAVRPPAETTTFETTVSIDDAWRANDKRDWQHSDNVPWQRTATFQRSTRELAGNRDEPFWAYRHITVVTADGEVDLRTHMYDAAERRTPHLFL
jgi:hypothetical protein